MDMAQFSKDTPAQTRERLQWIVDVFRENQVRVIEVLCLLHEGKYDTATECLSYMHKSDRDALLQKNGILKPEQIELLK